MENARDAKLNICQISCPFAFFVNVVVRKDVSGSFPKADKES